MQKYARGQIWQYVQSQTEDKYKSNNSVQRGSRPVIVVSNDVGNKHSPVVIVVPCTTQNKKELCTHFSFSINDIPNIALCEQIFTVGKPNLREYVGTLEQEELDKLNKCLHDSLFLGVNTTISEIKQNKETCEVQERLNDAVEKQICKDIKYTNPMEVNKEIPNCKHVIKPCDTKSLTFSVEKRTYNKRTEQEKQQIINEWSKCNKDDIEDLAKKYNFANSKMLIQAIKRWAK